ncbi:RagB/SusD family nutrient uptake outer membrane protein [Fulvivirga sp. M361]|uniref:RagB/SusD family nutrient uptake outer membrane protein n=1 Tax=Fulvivirga sp. M361 TaxID=2594266 RepID=UPI001179D31B|nr:RagB/SusD family nutrient uptake outer membrane protein [Fulvivirga sp. M361]TRX59517.1 RagB/SusD family nutrient uptake outer membrane protein [Fulvivirga sp. M361]
MELIKKITKLLTLLLLALALASCGEDTLELTPISAIADEEFYQNDDDLALATLAIYDGLQAVPLREFALTEMRSDNAETNIGEGEWAEFETLNVQTTNGAVATYWADNYNVIFRANVVLENLDVMTDEALKSQFEGEAKFARALAHFNLVRAFGAVPLVDRVLLLTDTEHFGRDEIAEVYSAITADLIDAAALLPSKGGIEFGRATSGAAQALLAKVYLTTDNHSLAEPLLAALIADPNYRLVEKYRDVFYDEQNSEIIFAIPYIDNNAIESQDFSFEMSGGGTASGLNYLTDDFLSSMTPSDTARNAVLSNPDNQKTTGKFLNEGSNARLAGNDWIVLRLADVYLMHVEAIMNGAGSTQSIAAIESYNAVRDRVGLSELLTDGSETITLEMLLNERRFELGFENHRLYDLVRTGQAMTVLTAFADAEGYNFNADDLLLPIPQNERNVSEGLLSQNPGYQQ